MQKLIYAFITLSFFGINANFWEKIDPYWFFNNDHGHKKAVADWKNKLQRAAYYRRYSIIENRIKEWTENPAKIKTDEIDAIKKVFGQDIIIGENGFSILSNICNFLSILSLGQFRASSLIGRWGQYHTSQSLKIENELSGIINLKTYLID